MSHGQTYHVVAELGDGCGNEGLDLLPLAQVFVAHVSDVYDGHNEERHHRTKKHLPSQTFWFHLEATKENMFICCIVPK